MPPRVRSQPRSDNRFSGYEVRSGAGDCGVRFDSIRSALRAARGPIPEMDKPRIGRVLGTTAGASPCRGASYVLTVGCHSTWRRSGAIFVVCSLARACDVQSWDPHGASHDSVCPLRTRALDGFALRVDCEHVARSRTARKHPGRVDRRITRRHHSRRTRDAHGNGQSQSRLQGQGSGSALRVGCRADDPRRRWQRGESGTRHLAGHRAHVGDRRRRLHHRQRVHGGNDRADPGGRAGGRREQRRRAP